MKKCLLIFIACFPFVLMAKNVKVDRASKVALEWYNHYAPSQKKGATISSLQEFKHLDKTSFYIFSFDKGGFVMVSANDLAEPIIGYGFEGCIPEKIDNPTVNAWFDNYARQIDTLNTINLKSSILNPKWETIEQGVFLKSEGISVEPLLTTKWDQGWPYNAMCPETNIGGSGGHTWAGCEAVAIAQILNFHKWPHNGAGSISYESRCFTGRKPDSISVNFSRQNFIWDSIPNFINEQNESIAKLIFNAGAAAGSQYGINSTVTKRMYVMADLEKKTATQILFSNFFRYNYDSIITISKGDDEEWSLILKKELDKGRPIYYEAGDLGKTSHSFVCDGYNENNYFHFNFGWGGLFNGYYFTNKINPDIYSFNDLQYATIGIIPDTSSIYINADTVWSGEQIHLNNIIIPRGNKLKLNPGTILKMGNGTKILSFGYFNSLGRSNNPVIITSNDTLNRWSGLILDENYLYGYNVYPNSDSTFLKNTCITFSEKDGLFFYGLYGFSSFFVDSCSFMNNKRNSINSIFVNLNLSNSTFNKENINVSPPNVNMENNQFKMCSIVITGGTNLRFRHNKVYHYSIMLLCDARGIIEKNIFYNNLQAIRINLSIVNVVNNLLFNNELAIHSYPSRGNKIINNTISNNKDGVVLDVVDELEEDLLLNNIIYNNDRNIIYNGNAHPSIKNSLIENGVNGIINSTPNDFDQELFTTVYDGNPDFINPSNSIGIDTSVVFENLSYELGKRSVAIDMAGQDSSGLNLPETDLNNKPRIIRKLDIGAYEFIGEFENKQPFVVVDPIQTVNEGEIVMLDGSSSYDPDGDKLSYMWLVPKGITLNSDSIDIPTFTAPEVDIDTDYVIQLIVNDGRTYSDTAKVTVTVKNIPNTAVTNYFDLGFTISPNPTTDIINLKFKDIPDSFVQILITDLTGRSILNKRYMPATNCTVNLSLLKAGIYLVTVNVNGKIENRKIVIDN